MFFARFHVGTSLMSIFDLYFSNRWSFLFWDTCLTYRRLCESYSSIWSQDILHRVSPGLFASLRIQCVRILRDATHLRYKFHNSLCILVVACSSFAGMVTLCRLFVCMFINLIMREQLLIPCFTFRFVVVELTIGRMSTLTSDFVQVPFK